ncbi:VHS domain-containing protein [Hibiscus syriacus]|uniref:VHS domain-containing protein n=1 Tax=Hibiscus syriacus TaxID=106335 RepID=A0A6A3A573_HIBSY|nr:VHS domain-containing protein [Hibiscus syriacus]
MIDGATSDEDKVTPVYKLEVICELLRSVHVSVVKEALRLIKYAVGKSGVEFSREMQRNSVAVRQLFHYKGQPDPLKGDALNKAVRETAHEAISAIFSEENNTSKPPPVDDFNKRIEGFGNTNFEMPSSEKKSFLSEVVGIGSSSIKQGISSFTQGRSVRKNDNGNYKSPALRRSLTTEIDNSDRYDPVELHSDTREAFLMEAARLDALAVSHALESKLLSPVWQVRMKAMCVLESILRRKKDEHFYAGIGATEQKDDDDPFVGVSFHTGESRENVVDLFSGITIDDKSVINSNHVAANKKSELIDIFGTTSETPFEPENKNNSINDLMAGLSMKENLSNPKQKGITSEGPENIFANINTHSSHQASNDALSGILGSQATGMTTNAMFPL